MEPALKCSLGQVSFTLTDKASAITRWDDLQPFRGQVARNKKFRKRGRVVGKTGKEKVIELNYIKIKTNK